MILISALGMSNSWYYSCQHCSSILADENLTKSYGQPIYSHTDLILVPKLVTLEVEVS